MMPRLEANWHGRVRIRAFCLCLLSIAAWSIAVPVEARAQPQQPSTSTFEAIESELYPDERAEFEQFRKTLTPDGVRTLDRIIPILDEGQRGTFALLLMRSDSQAANDILWLFDSFDGSDFDYVVGQFRSRTYEDWEEIPLLLKSERVEDVRVEFLRRHPDQCWETAPESIESEAGGEPGLERPFRLCPAAMVRFRETYLRKVQRVVRGMLAQPGDAPWQAQLALHGASTRAFHTSDARKQQREQFGRELHDWEINHVCGAVYIGGKFLLTAAHCIGGLPSARFFPGRRIRLGTQRIDGDHNLVRIRTVLTHRDFNPTSFENDIALIELESEPDFRALKPADLPPAEGHRPQQSRLLLSGWGYRRATTSAGNARALDGEYQDRATAQLRKADLFTRPSSRCDNNKIFRRNGMRILTGQFCAGTSTGTDSCRGDSGGPLVDNATGILVGLVSNGKGCGIIDTPAIYVDVAHYRDWIDRAMDAAPRLKAQRKYTFR